MKHEKWTKTFLGSQRYRLYVIEEMLHLLRDGKELSLQLPMTFDYHDGRGFHYYKKTTLGEAIKAAL